MVVGRERDPLCAAFVNQGTAAGRDIRLVEPDRLGDCSIMLDSDGFTANGARIDAVFFHARPHDCFSVGFCVEDQAFVDVELTATWLAAMSPPRRCVNRYDAQTWFERSPWTAWRPRLCHAGVAVAGLALAAEPDYAHRWLPYSHCECIPAPGKHSTRALGAALVRDADLHELLLVAGEPLGSAADDSSSCLGAVLAELGIGLAQALVSSNGVVALDTVPVIEDQDLAANAAQQLLTWIGF
jgi:hypothetical protein